MGILSNVHWCDSAANPTSGCEGCELWIRSRGVFICYAGRTTERYGGSNSGLSPKFEMVIPRAGRMREAAHWPALLGTDRSDLKLPKPWLDGLPRVIFISDMGDALSEGITFEFLENEIIDSVTSLSGRKHIWLWLTKQPKKAVFFSIWLRRRSRAWPENLWAGTSVTSQATVGRIADILKVGDERTRHFLSLEPQHGPLDFGELLPRLDWLIHGGQSAPEKNERDTTPAFDLDWVRTLKKACAAADVPYFLKQLGAHVVDGGKRLVLKDASHGGESEEWPNDLRGRDARQMPRVKMLAGVQRGETQVTLRQAPPQPAGPPLNIIVREAPQPSPGPPVNIIIREAPQPQRGPPVNFVIREAPPPHPDLPVPLDVESIKKTFSRKTTSPSKGGRK